MNIDLLKSVDQNILDLIIAKNVGLEMTLEQVTIGAASELVDDPSGRNSQVTLTALANKGFSGSRVIKYNRLGLDSGVAALPATINVNPSDTAEQLKTKACAALGLMESEVDVLVSFDSTEYTLADAVTGSIFPENEDDTSVSFIFRVPAAGSKLYIGSDVTVQMTVPDTDIPLSVAIADDVMDGFDAVVA